MSLTPISRLLLSSAIVCAVCLHTLFRSETAHSQINELIDLELQKEHARTGQKFTPQCSDETFVRRLYLDLSGTVPSPGQFKRFVSDESPNKRTVLIDDLLAAPSFGVRLADRWDIELCHPELEWPIMPFTNWLQNQFNANQPWDRLAHELLTATGPQYKNPAVTVFFGMSKSDTLSPEDATDLVGRAFMGIKLECAQCHDHPYAAEWSHERYWKLASLVGRTKLSSRWPRTEDLPRTSEDRGRFGTHHGVINSTKTDWPSKLPDRSLKFPPRFPDGRPGRVRPEHAREVFADWLLHSEVPYLSRAFVNRTWHHLFGCGFVTPVDDHRAGNPPLYPQLQARLTTKFLETGYDIKQLYRGICRSRTYQQESRSHEDPRTLSGVNIRAVSPNQMFDMLYAVLDEKAVTNPNGILGGRGARRKFLRTFGDEAAKGRPELFSKTMLDFLQMLNSARLEGGIRRQITSHEKLRNDPSKMIDELYVLAVSRLPSYEEKNRMTEFVKQSTTVDEGYRGVLWALMNTGEFCLIQ